MLVIATLIISNEIKTWNFNQCLPYTYKSLQSFDLKRVWRFLRTVIPLSKSLISQKHTECNPVFIRDIWYWPFTLALTSLYWCLLSICNIYQIHLYVQLYPPPFFLGLTLNFDFWPWPLTSKNWCVICICSIFIKIS